MPVLFEYMTSSTNRGAQAPTTGAAFCAACGASLSAGARFCHRCGTPVGQGAPLEGAPLSATPSHSTATILPWGIAFLALLALVATFAGRNFGASEGARPPLAAPGLDASGGSPSGAPIAGATGPAPNIANMSPSERASRLYVRVMEYAEAGKVDSVATFAPMVIAAHEMLPSPTLDERYHFGRVAEVVGASAIAKAQADTILTLSPQSLLGLVLAARAARLEKNENVAKSFDKRLLAALAAELATTNPEAKENYENHRAEIDRAVADARRPN